jgi:large subunit ribosomal protein L13
MLRQTTMAKKEEIVRKWYVIDATDKPLGRLASEVAMVIMGKHKPTFTPHVDCGDFVIIVNAKKVGLSGDKLNTRTITTCQNTPAVSGLGAPRKWSTAIRSRWSSEPSGA